MRKNLYRFEFFIMALWIIAVILFFKLIPNKQVASLVAGLGFVLIPSVFIFLEFKKAKAAISHVVILAVFLVLAALPIFLSRILNWGQDFSSLTVFGVPLELIHKYSNGLYIIMMLSALYQVYFGKEKGQP